MLSQSLIGHYWTDACSSSRSLLRCSASLAVRAKRSHLVRFRTGRRFAALQVRQHADQSHSNQRSRGHKLPGVRHIVSLCKQPSSGTSVQTAGTHRGVRPDVHRSGFAAKSEAIVEALLFESRCDESIWLCFLVWRSKVSCIRFSSSLLCTHVLKVLKLIKVD